MRSRVTTVRHGTPPDYTIRFPGKLWTTLLEQNIFAHTPEASRTAYAKAVEHPKHAGFGSTRIITGTSEVLLPLLARLQVIVTNIRNGHDTASRFDAGLRQIDRCAHQMLIIVKETS
jgi:hypothetical protein